MIQDLKIKCDRLKALSSIKDKKQFLKENEADEEFIGLLKFLLDPKIVTGISDAKINKPLGVINYQLVYSRLLELLDYLKTHSTGTDNDIEVCQGSVMFIVRKHNVELEEFVKSIITKSLKLGVDTKIANAVYGKDFIPVHEVQQGMGRDKLRLKEGETFFLTQKLNGVRGTYINGQLISRQGTVFNGLEHIVKELQDLDQKFEPSMVFDGELIRRNIDNLPDNENFRIGTGLINSDDIDKSCIEFVMFDMLPMEEFFKGSSMVTYSIRRAMMDFNMGNYQYIRFTPLLYRGSDTTEIDKWLAYADSHNWEGCMLNKNVPYYTKRHSGLIKIKSFKHSDLKIVGYEEGTNKYAGKLGAIIVEYKGNTVNVGSGFTDDQRREYWECKDSLIGKIAQVKYKEESTDKKTGLKSIQFPIFEMLREDKMEESVE